MFEGKDVLVILAQAGSGKTRRLIEEVSKELEVRRPEEVSFVTFTRKGAEEGLHRVCSKLRYEPSDLPYFRTLHSLTFHALNLKADQMFGRIDQREFNSKYGYNVNRCEVSDSNAMPTKDSMYLEYYDLERSDALQSFQIAEADIEVGYYNQIVRDYEEYKAEHNKVDYFDCLVKYIKYGEPLPISVGFIDECQDLTLLQWKVVEKAFSRAKRIIAVGDENQAIFTYSGGRPDYLIELSKKHKTENLSVSYRIPRAVFDLAHAVIDFVGSKTDKPFEFREGNPEGSVTSIDCIERAVNMVREEDYAANRNTTEWYFLSRNNCYLNEPMSLLEERLIPYWNADGFFMGGNIMKRLRDYERFKLKGYKSEEKKEAFMRKFGITDFSVPFTDTNLFTEGRKWVYAAYVEKYGLDTLEDMCKWNPQILVSTIHHVKGGEARNVAVMLDVTRRTTGNLYKDIDEELRVLYVAITRAKENLFLADSRDGNGYDSIIQTLKEEYGLNF